jgi:MOSC domain-containing protein YiiM
MVEPAFLFFSFLARKNMSENPAWVGVVAGLFIAPEAGAPMRAVEAVRAVPGRGLEGDRYYEARGSFSRWPGAHRAVTLIAEEALAEMAAETGVILAPAASRRNVLVRGVPVNDLIKKAFVAGDVRMEGLRLCQPCKYLARRSGVPGVLPGLIGRGGLRARILDEGFIRVGDPVHLSS